MVKVRQYKRRDGTKVVSHTRSSPEHDLRFKAGDKVEKKSASKKSDVGLKEFAKPKTNDLYSVVWAKNKGVFYRGSNDDGKGSGLALLGNGVYLTWTEKMAFAFATISVINNGGSPFVEKFKLPKSLKMLDFQSDEAWEIRKSLGVESRWDKIDDALYVKIFTGEVKSRGYDGVISDNVADGLVVFDPNVIKPLSDYFVITSSMRYSYGRVRDSYMIKTDKDIIEREKRIDWIVGRVQDSCLVCIKDVDWAKHLMRERMTSEQLYHPLWSHLSSDKSSGVLFAEQLSDPSEAIIFVDVDYLINRRGNTLGGVGKSVEHIKELVANGTMLESVPVFYLDESKVGEGNHRVEALKELGYESVPVALVGGWE